jgi:glucose-6-phosphate 1-dehydrogenase
MSDHATYEPLVPTTVPSAPPATVGSARPDPCLVVLFGATGDLARNDLVPALFELWVRGLLPERFAILGSARRELHDEGFRDLVREGVAKHPTYDRERWEAFAGRLHYVPSDARASADGEGWQRFDRRLDELRETNGLPPNTLFHLAVPPAVFTDIVQRLDALGETGGTDGWRRVAVEKPFGHDERSARKLDAAILEHFDDERVYRVDHFLGKETVQNLLVTRFANPGFEPIWNRHYIDHVQITAAEPGGVSGRESFYEGTGVIRDMVQNHVLQLLCMVAAEPPIRCVGTAFRNETVRALRSVRSPDPERDLVVGQYREGRVDDRAVRGYRDEVSDDESRTATYAALRLELDGWRWEGVPFYLRTGKRMRRKVTEVAIHFRATPQSMFPNREPFRSTLTFRLQPEEAVVHEIAAKQPGPGLAIRPVRMRYSYADAFGLDSPPSAYAWLIHDALSGDSTLFARSDWIYRAWSLIDPLTEAIESSAPLPYPAGSWGPEPAAQLLEREGRRWSLT